MANVVALVKERSFNDIEYIKLGDCCKIEKGNTAIQKATPGDYPLVVTSAERKTCASYQFEGETVCIPLVSSRGHGVASLNQLHFQAGKFALGNILCAVQPDDPQKLDAKYLFHYLENRKDTLIVPLMRGGANVSLNPKSLRGINIPIPPIEVQQEIVRILDAMCELEASLKEELEAREKQFEAYCEKLFKFDGQTVTRKPLGEIAFFSGGKTPSMKDPSLYDLDGYLWVTSKDMKAKVISDTGIKVSEKALGQLTLYPSGTILMVFRSGILRHTLPIAKLSREAAINQDLKAIIVSEEVDTDWVYSCLLGTRNAMLKKCRKEGGTVDSLDASKVSRYEIPIPPIEEQQEIVAKLDVLEALSQSLRDEITARHTQYEHYRDKLLSFDKLEKGA